MSKINNFIDDWWPGILIVVAMIVAAGTIWWVAANQADPPEVSKEWQLKPGVTCYQFKGINGVTCVRG